MKSISFRKALWQGTHTLSLRPLVFLRSLWPALLTSTTVSVLLLSWILYVYIPKAAAVPITEKVGILEQLHAGFAALEWRDYLLLAGAVLLWLLSEILLRTYGWKAHQATRAAAMPDSEARPIRPATRNIYVRTSLLVLSTSLIAILLLALALWLGHRWLWTALLVLPLLPCLGLASAYLRTTWALPLDDELPTCLSLHPRLLGKHILIGIFSTILLTFTGLLLLLPQILYLPAYYFDQSALPEVGQASLTTGFHILLLLSFAIGTMLQTLLRTICWRWTWELSTANTI